jgi:thiamine-monophosphate kinase
LPTVKLDWINKFIEGFATIANQFNVALIGGDTIRGPEFFAVSLQGVVYKDQYIARSGAKTDDLIYVSGQLGDASYGLNIIKEKTVTEDNQLLVDKFLYPNPRIEEAKTISLFASSMIDLSDGLYSDLMKIMSESSVGAEVDVSKLPISALLSDLLSEEAAINQALLGGDDYELCFTLPVDREVEFLEAHRSLSDPFFTCIGKIRQGSDMRLLDGKQDFVISEKPYNHF